MGNNYEFKFNPKKPSREEIARHKDFGKLLKRYQSEQRESDRRIARIRRIYIGSAVAAAIAAVAILMGGFFSSPTVPTITAEAYFQQKDFVAPPIKEIEKNQFASFRVEADKGGVYEYPSGSRLVIPASAFADDYGTLIQGEVDVYYREMYDYVDFFTSGINMKYDSTNNTYFLESAGMVEIYAEQNGQRLQLAAGKTFDIELVSEIYLSDADASSIPAYHIYQIDTFNHNWIYHGQNKMKVSDEKMLDESDPLYKYKKDLFDRLSDIENRAAIDLLALEKQYPKPIAPLKPQRADGNLPTLELNFLDGSINVEDSENGNLQSELAKMQQAYSGIIWQVSPNSPAYDERAFGVEWESVNIRPTNSRDYELTLIHPQNQLTLIVAPVLTGNEYQRAMSNYQTELVAYEAALAEREQLLVNQKEALEASIKAQKAAVMDAYKTQLEALRTTGLQYNERSMLLAKRKVVNHFTAPGLGIWNCARPVASGGETIIAAFRDQYGERYTNHTTYVVRKGSNHIRQYYANGKTDLQLIPDADYLIWVVSDDQKIAVLHPDNFNWPKDSEATYTFQLELKDKTFDSKEEIRNILQF